MAKNSLRRCASRSVLSDAADSPNRAQKRIARQRLEADLQLGAILQLRKKVYKELKVWGTALPTFLRLTYVQTYTTYSSEVGDDRPLSIARFSPDSNLLATGSWSGLVKLWDVPTCRPRAILKGPPKRCSAVAAR